MIGMSGILHGFSLGVGYELTRRIFIPALVVSVPLVLWRWFGPVKPTCDEARTQAAREAVAQVVERIHAERGDARRAAVMHFVNDPTDFITTTLRERLIDSGTLDVDGAEWGERIRRLLNLRVAGVFDGEAALAYGRKWNLDAVIIGSVEVFETVKGRGNVSGKVKLVKVKTGETVDIPLSNGNIPGAMQPQAVATMSLPLRLFLTLACLVAMPLLLFPLLRVVMKHDTNLATAGLLLFLLAVDSLIIFMMLGLRGTFGGMAAFLIVLALAFGYDLFMLSYAQLCSPNATTR